MVWKAALAITVAALGAPAFAQPANSGQENVPDMRCDTNAGAAVYLFCAGRINGFIFGHELSANPETQSICRPKNTTVLQAADIYRAYFIKHPDRQQADWRVLTALALNEAWPCPNGRRWEWDARTQDAKLRIDK